MTRKLAIVGASGKLGFATLNALLDHKLIAPEDIVCTTSSSTGAQKLEPARQRGVEVRSAEWDDRTSWTSALQGCSSMFLISSARVERDFNEAPPGQGRERDHFTALEAAQQVGVQHVYYTSLAFANPSLSRVMKAHERTEQYLKESSFTYTIIREGLYNESWPLYLGHYHLSNDNDRSDIVVAGDSKINWTSIEDLGLATAIILTTSSSSDYHNKTLYLAQRQAHTLAEVAAMVSQARSSEIQLRVVSRAEHERYYIEERGESELYIKWWSKTYDALRANECEMKDDDHLEKLLGSKGRKPKHMSETVREMMLSATSNQGT